ncbi:MAG TPA: PfkB family carbohydrate kinase [Dehalococcoidia bacterium]|nr:PfkB family carbohydrate kinase [Dehalococcoidia bacterium]
MAATSNGDQILVVGSLGFDDVETPFGRAVHVLGGSTIYFSAAASLFAPVNVVSVVGTDMPLESFDFLRRRGVDLSGLQVAEGQTFHWAGRYNYDLNSRETLATDLNVYADFHPRLPSKYELSPFVFLANIHPNLQREVLGQARKPRLTMMDTMNLWIEHERESLLETMRLVDMVCMNEEEARELSGAYSLVAASRYILGLGPRVVLIKKGENGCAMITPEGYFMAPAYPLEEVYDPTGAGDSFAGGFLGYLASCGDLGDENLRRAVVYGSAVASFTVERFSVDRLRDLSRREIDDRYGEFRRLTLFEAV